MERPTIPGDKDSLAITANKAAKNTIQLPTNSSLTANHLQIEKKTLGPADKTNRVKCGTQQILRLDWASVQSDQSLCNLPKRTVNPYTISI